MQPDLKAFDILHIATDYPDIKLRFSRLEVKWSVDIPTMLQITSLKASGRNLTENKIRRYKF